ELALRLDQLLAELERHGAAARAPRCQVESAEIIEPEEDRVVLFPADVDADRLERRREGAIVDVLAVGENAVEIEDDATSPRSAFDEGIERALGEAVRGI